jgi:predicted phage tail protein
MKMIGASILIGGILQVPSDRNTTPAELSAKLEAEKKEIEMNKEISENSVNKMNPSNLEETNGKSEL